MYFVIAFFTVSTVGALITARTLCGYNQISSFWKISAFLLLWIMWNMPVILGGIRHSDWLQTEVYAKISMLGYFLFGTAFLLFGLVLLRDIVWGAGYGAAKLLGWSSQNWSPLNINVLTKVNIITLFLAFGCSVYSLYEGIKMPNIKEITIKTPAVNKEVKILQINDMHIERGKTARHFAKVVDWANAQNADLILMPGDIVDDNVEAIIPQLGELKNLKSRYGTYISAGNHELYNGLIFIQKKLTEMGINWLSGSGENIDGLPIYVAGIPDLPTLRQKSGFENILADAKSENYKILLLHNPTLAKDYINSGFDLVLSGHTHGGQIFPFHFPVLAVNKYLAGLYEFPKGKLHISRGAGYWGPPMRLLAPSDMTLIRLMPDVDVP